MEYIKKLINENMKFVDYLSLYNKINNSCSLEKLKMKKMKIYILRSFTCEQLKEILTVDCIKENFDCNVFIGGFNQYTEEILDIKSDLYTKNPDIIIMALRLEEIYPEIFTKYVYLKDDLDNLKEKIILNIENLVSNIKNNSKAIVLINNFITPIHSYSGIYDFQNKDGQINFIRSLNFNLTKLIKKYKGVYIVDLEHIASNIGKSNILDKKMMYISKNPYKPSFYISLSKEYMKYIKANSGIKKKCIVLDLDNTLWGGIIGEDGFNGIRLGDNYPGICYKEFQIEIMKLKSRGIILAINSKNNYEDAIKVINEHPDMILREKDFACIKVNWKDKASNLQQIAYELNIGVDSLIFVDDNPAECELIKQAFNNEVSVVNLPNNPILYGDIIKSLNYFESLNITDEDLKKTEIYNSQIERKALKESCCDLESYYKSLKMIAEIREVDDFSISRIAQLTQKTNQFNMTTRRYTEEDILNMTKSKFYTIYYLRVKDVFGDNGIVGVCIIKKQSDTWYIDTFLISCRIMKRTLENAFISYIYRKAKEQRIEKLIGEFITTNKNISVKNFYRNLKFKEYSCGNFIFYINYGEIKCPSYIKIIGDDYNDK